jgi:hypothetical protein
MSADDALAVVTQNINGMDGATWQSPALLLFRAPRCIPGPPRQALPRLPGGGAAKYCAWPTMVHL